MQYYLPVDQSVKINKDDYDLNNNVNSDEEKELLERLENLKERKNKQYSKKNTRDETKPSMALINKVKYEGNKMDSLKNHPESNNRKESNNTPLQPIHVTIRFISHYTKPLTIFWVDEKNNIRDSFVLKTKSVINMPTQVGVRWYKQENGVRKNVIDVENMKAGSLMKVVINEEYTHTVEYLEDIYEGQMDFSQPKESAMDTAGSYNKLKKTPKRRTASIEADPIEKPKKTLVRDPNQTKIVEQKDDLVLTSDDEKSPRDSKNNLLLNRQSSQMLKIEADIKKSKIDNFFIRNNAMSGETKTYLKNNPSRKTKNQKKLIEEEFVSECTFQPKICNKSKHLTEEIDPFFLRVQEGEYIGNREQKIKKKLEAKYKDDIEKKQNEESRHRNTQSTKVFKAYNGFSQHPADQTEFDTLLTRNFQWIHNKEQKIYVEIEKAEKMATNECTHVPITNKKFNGGIKGDFMKRLDFDVHRRKNNINTLENRSYSNCSFKPMINDLQQRSSARGSSKSKLSKKMNKNMISGDQGFGKSQPTMLVDNEDMIPRDSNLLPEVEGANMKHKNIMKGTKNDDGSSNNLTKNRSYKMFKVNKTEADDLSDFNNNNFDVYDPYDQNLYQSKMDLRGSGENYHNSVAKNLESIKKMKKECDDLLVKETCYNQKDEKSIVFSKSMKNKLKVSSNKHSPERSSVYRRVEPTEQENYIEEIVISKGKVTKPTGNMRIIYADTNTSRKMSGSNRSLNSNRSSGTNLRKSNKTLFTNTKIYGSTNNFDQKKHEFDVTKPKLVADVSSNDKHAIKSPSKKESRENKIDLDNSNKIRVYEKKNDKNYKREFKDENYKYANFVPQTISLDKLSPKKLNCYVDYGDENVEVEDQPRIDYALLNNINQPIFKEKQISFEKLGDSINKNEVASRAKVLEIIDNPIMYPNKNYEIYGRNNNQPNSFKKTEYGGAFQELGQPTFFVNDTNDSIEIIKFNEDLKESVTLGKDPELIDYITKSSGKTPNDTLNYSNRNDKSQDVGLKFLENPKKSTINSNRTSKNTISNKSKINKSATQVINTSNSGQQQSSYAKRYDKKTTNLNGSTKNLYGNPIRESDLGMVSVSDSNDKWGYEVEVIDKSNPYDKRRKNLKR